jgi:hypothetical protein
MATAPPRVAKRRIERPAPRGADGINDMIVLTLLARRLSFQGSATAGVPLLA